MWKEICEEEGYDRELREVENETCVLCEIIKKNILKVIYGSHNFIQCKDQCIVGSPTSMVTLAA